MVTTFAEQGIETVFEGIEEDWQLELAERSGATMVQGYALARPEIAPTSFAIFAQQSPEDPLGASESSIAPASQQARKPERARPAFGRRVARP
jgi:EAL domain-containing protein (putative c-di-GMP-specific phosphodiesterase class I)